MMKKLTIITLIIFVITLGLSYLNKRVFDLEPVIGFVDSIMAIGGFLFFVFLIAWQAEVGRTQLIITVVIVQLVFLSFMIYSFIKADEAEKIRYYTDERYESSLKVIESLKELNDESISVIDSLQQELSDCK